MAVFALVMLETGVGDEVTLVGGVFLLVLAMVLAWLSTHVAENGDHMIGAIISGGTPLVGLGDSTDHYRRPTPSTDPIEPQPTTHPQEDKPEDDDTGQVGENASLEDSTGPSAPTVSNGAVDLHLDIQGLHKRTAVASASATMPTTSCLSPEGDLHTEKGINTTDEMTTPCSSTSTTIDIITVRLKFLNDTEELAVVRPEDSIGHLTSKHFSGKERQIKLIYKGQLLRDPSQTLISLNISHNSVIHCHISPNPPPAEEEELPPSEVDLRSDGGSVGLQTEPLMGPGAGSRSEPATESGLEMNVGSLVVPMFVLMLAVIWYFRINYRQLFTAPATVSLMGVTIFFSFLIFGMYGR